MGLRIDWDRYEVAILIDYFFMCERGELTHNNAVSLASLELRARAVHRGITIDEVYRNETGIHMQLKIVEKEVYEVEGGLRNGSKLFLEMLDLYRNEKVNFDKILDIANYANTNLKYTFIRWFINRTKTKEPLNLVPAYTSIENFLKSRNVIRKSFFDITDANEVLKLYKYTEKYFKQNTTVVNLVKYYYIWVSKIYINDLSEKDYILEVLVKQSDTIINQSSIHPNLNKCETITETINENEHRHMLNTYSTIIRNNEDSTENNTIKDSNEDLYSLVLEFFPLGYRINSTMDYGKLCNKYLNKFNDKLDLTSKEVENILLTNGFVFNEMIILERLFFTENVELNDFLKNVDTLIYFEKLLEIFDTKINSYMKDVEKIRAYIESKNKNNYYITSNYVTKIENRYRFTPDLLVENVMMNWGYKISLSELEDQLKYITTEEIQKILNTKKYMSVEKDTYIYVDLIDISEDTLSDMKENLLEIVEANGHISNNDFYDIIKYDYKSIIDENPVFDENADFVYKYFKTLFNDDFTFNRKIITLKNVDMSAKGAWEDFCSKNDIFNYDDLEILRTEMKISNINFNVVMEYCVRINGNEFKNRRLFEFNIDEIDEYIEYILENAEYKAINNIENFESLPSVGYKWNCFLLESYVHHFSIKYKIMKPGNFSKNCVSTIVKSNTVYTNIDDVFADVIIKNNIELSEEKILNFLFENKYLQMRKYSKINEVMKLVRKLG